MEKNTKQFKWITSRVEVMPRTSEFKKEYCETTNSNLEAELVPLIDPTKDTLTLSTIIFFHQLSRRH